MKLKMRGLQHVRNAREELHPWEIKKCPIIQLTCSRTILAPSYQPMVGLTMSMIVDCHHLAIYSNIPLHNVKMLEKRELRQQELMRPSLGSRN